MQQNAKFIRKLPIPMDIKKEFPLSERVSAVRWARVEEMRAILDGRDRRLMLIIGPCSADREDAVLEYAARLRWTAGPLLSALSAERLNSTDRKPLLFAHFPSGARPQRRV